MTIVLSPLIANILQGIITLIKTWWWIFAPLVLYFPARFFYKYWLQWSIWYPRQKWAMFELIPAAEIERPFKAMEAFFHSVWSIIDQPNWREEWCEGEPENGPFWFSLEIVSKAGEIHFYLRILEGMKPMFDSYIHTHYPQTEIRPVQDYTKQIPTDLPNEKMDLYGEEFYFTREDFYPLRTYPFFEIQPGETGEEKRVEPFVALMEAITQLKPGEEYWFQIIPIPIDNTDIPWQDQGREKANEIARRPKKAKPKSLLSMLLSELVSWTKALGRALTGESVQEEEKPLEIPPTEISAEGEVEMRLTPGEKEILTAIENKISKHGFKTCFRNIYLYERDVYVSAHGKIGRTYMSYFNTDALNQLVHYSKLRTRVHYFFRKRRLAARKKAILRRYIARFPPHFPKRQGPGLPILNAEELASIFHYPSQAYLLPPGVPRIPAKKGGPPPNLPIEG